MDLDKANNRNVTYLMVFTKMSLTGLLLLLFNSCILTVPKERRPCYKELKKFADENWKFSNNDSILIENKTVFSQARGNEEVARCSKQMTVKEIKRIFGEPHEISKYKNGIEHRFYYYTMNCYPSVTKVKGCIFYGFDFNEEGECISFWTGGS